MNRYCRAILCQQKDVILTNDTTVAIIVTGSRAETWEPGDKASNAPKYETATLTLIRLFKAVSIASHTQQTAGVLTKVSGIVSIKPNQSLLENHIVQLFN